MIDKKEAKKKYKQTLPPMGVFQIKNLINGKILIGNSKNLTGKFNSYKFQLNSSTHMNADLQADYKKYSENNFSFEILDKLEPKDDPAYDYADDLKVLEELWIDKLQPFGDKGYNEKVGK